MEKNTKINWLKWLIRKVLELLMSTKGAENKFVKLLLLTCCYFAGYYVKKKTQKQTYIRVSWRVCRNVIKELLVVFLSIMCKIYFIYVLSNENNTCRLSFLNLNIVLIQFIRFFNFKFYCGMIWIKFFLLVEESPFNTTLNFRLWINFNFLKIF